MEKPNRTQQCEVRKCEPQTVAEDPDEQLKFYSSSEAKTRLNNPIFSVSLLTEANIPISKQSKSLEYD